MDLDNEINNHHANISEQEDIIIELKKELDDEKIIKNRTKEYLFVLENRISKKDKKIKSQDKKIKSQDKKIKLQDKKIKKLKKENRILKTSTSWKITAPLRKLMSFVKRYY
ncbi:hypothetical protein [Methanobrevibacter olleyae]|uniref:Uncharacterized protein n=1 Tax=Methanobrevibacter olleyae TaxID=294671 RepID=A0A126R0D6_METOL|nr:hypothetical protein [Methanobrevibacter olleyae]AMK15419.1 hypothetical protein YLM1_0862 [Methanobrevibacter olleyae]